jgi:uncharacterized protein YycO
MILKIKKDTMKRLFLAAVLITGTFFTTVAQDNPAADAGMQQERIKALYVAFITEKLSLTADEAQKFWPVHTQFHNDIKGVKQDLPELQKQQAVLDIKKKYQDNFTRILGNKRCEHFFRLDGEFKKKLFEKIRKQRMDQQRPKIRRGV